MSTTPPSDLHKYRIPIYQVRLVREGTHVHEAHRRPNARSPEAVAALLSDYLRDVDREHLVIIFVDTKHRLIGLHTACIGTLNATPIHPREVFKPALLVNAAGIILGHNHPSGDPHPSREDRGVTRRMIEAGELLGIQVVDHVIVGDRGRFVSLRDEGLVDWS